MRTIHVSAITDAVKKLCMEANYDPRARRAARVRPCAGHRALAGGKQVLHILKDNAELARTKKIPYCQDTGFVVCFVDVGQDVHIEGGLLVDAVNEGIRAGYTEGYLRASIVRSPFDRVNTGDNTPAVIHTELVAGQHAAHPDHGEGRRLREPLEVQDAHARGGHATASRPGCSSASRPRGPTPARRSSPGWEWAAPSSRPPSSPRRRSSASWAAPNPDPVLDALERELLERANRLGIGPAGLWRRHHRARHPRAHLSLPHHQPAGGGHDRVPRAPAQGSGAVIRTAADGIKEVLAAAHRRSDVEALASGDRVRITGALYTARDAAHARLQPLVDAGRPLPIDVRGQIIYYTGPSPARPGQVVGSVGPTTGGRMDTYTPSLLALGLKGHHRQGRAVAAGEGRPRPAQGGASAPSAERARCCSGFVKKLEVGGLRGPRHRGHPAPRGGRLPRHRDQRLPRRGPVPGRHEAVFPGAIMSQRILGNQRGEVIPGATLRTDTWWLLPAAVVIVLGAFIVLLHVGRVPERALLRGPVSVAVLLALPLEVVPAPHLRGGPAGHPDAHHRPGVSAPSSSSGARASSD